ncbi:hypothetical protein HDU76_004655 [Blyttiomyces sp. JEL0837]|nr:hypothetical protein HDU76_004655 [Blyttiomyces sp. JEL0837]
MESASSSSTSHAVVHPGTANVQTSAVGMSVAPSFNEAHKTSPGKGGDLERADDAARRSSMPAQRKHQRLSAAAQVHSSVNMQYHGYRHSLPAHQYPQLYPVHHPHHYHHHLHHVGPDSESGAVDDRLETQHPYPYGPYPSHEVSTQHHQNQHQHNAHHHQHHQQPSHFQPPMHISVVNRGYVGALASPYHAQYGYPQQQLHQQQQHEQQQQQPQQAHAAWCQASSGANFVMNGSDDADGSPVDAVGLGIDQEENDATSHEYLHSPADGFTGYYDSWYANYNDGHGSRYSSNSGFGDGGGNGSSGGRTSSYRLSAMMGDVCEDGISGGGNGKEDVDEMEFRRRDGMDG